MKDYMYVWLCIVVLNIFTFYKVRWDIALVVLLVSICWGYMARQLSFVEDELSKIRFIASVHTDIFVKHNAALEELYRDKDSE